MAQSLEREEKMWSYKMNDSFSIRDNDDGDGGGYSTGFSLALSLSFTQSIYDEFAGNLKIYACHKMFHCCWHTK